MSIIIENLNHIYMKGTPFEKAALDNISIEIDSGEFVGIIGHTGSGKTTFIQHLNGLLKPTSGRITVNGLEVSESNLKDLRKQVGIVFQYPEHQLFEETVFKDIAFGLFKMGFDESEIENKVMEAINTVGLSEEILNKSPFELSGGQKRRVAIAGVIAMNPKILVLDEPTAGLDPKGRQDLLNFIAGLHKEKGITILLVSHNMEDIVKMATKVIVINKGSIALTGETREVFKDISKIEELGLSAPQITYFMIKLNKRIPEINPNILTTKEARDEIIRVLLSSKKK